ncbi:hypothetical protein [Roseospira navarrensis]|uniref:Aggregation factor core n=1 Tax=Roseospira navarrensis TaxID=140058 RepID=A0A7X1ZGZ3_9PROT|nr:hypothetical protein [Roseospira navarrensis]MQX38187.1 hypothetical protein [Roseospira navarrensis]
MTGPWRHGAAGAVLALGLIGAAGLKARAADPPQADLVVRFEERLGADRFFIENTGTCLAVVMAVTIDLRGTGGGLVFDTVAGGGGVGTAYPFLPLEGADKLAGAGGGSDGGHVLSLDLTGLSQGERVVISIDVDEERPDGGGGLTQIFGRQFENGTVTATIRAPDGVEQTHTGRFDGNGWAFVNPRTCAVS